MDSEEVRSCLVALEVCNLKNRELLGRKIAERREKDIQAKLAVLATDPLAAKIIPPQSVYLPAKRNGPNIILRGDSFQ